MGIWNFYQLLNTQYVKKKCYYRATLDPKSYPSGDYRETCHLYQDIYFVYNISSHQSVLRMAANYTVYGVTRTLVLDHMNK